MTRKVLHVYRTYFPETQGGLEEAIRQIAHGTKAYGFETRVLCLKAGKDDILEQPEATVIRCRRIAEIASCGFSLSAVAKFKEQLEWADIVHYHFPWPFADMLHFMAGVKQPTVLTYHSDIIKQQGLMLTVYSPLMHAFLKSVTQIVATSDNYIKTSPVLQKYAHKTVAIPLGLDESYYLSAPPPVLEKITKQYGNDFILFVGVFRYYKGLTYLLQAAHHLQSQHGITVPLVLAGSNHSMPELKQQACDLNLKSVHFTGFVPDSVKNALLHNCLATVMPSHLRSEAFGLSLVESAMHGKAMISCDLGTGTSFVNKNGVTGHVVPPADIPALATALMSFAQNPGETRKMGQAARIRYETLFSGTAQGKSYRDLYEEILIKQQSSKH